MAIDTDMLKNRATGMMSGFSTGQRAVVIVAVLTLVAGGALFTQWVTKPTMVPLFTSLNAEDASAITGKLQSNGTDYELADGGATILVPQSQQHQARLDMAGQGLPSGGSQGYKLLDKQGITTSEFREKVGYQRALEGELSNTIGSIKDVEAATVHLVIPKQDVFAEDERKPSASVLVKTTAGKTLAGGQVQSIVHLVASSVEGLDPANVTLADGNGRMLAAPGQGVSGGNDTQHQATMTVEDTITKKVQTLLTPLVGQGKAVVQARAQLNWDASKTTAEIFNPNNKPVTPISQRSTSETYGNGGGVGTTGCLGAGVPVNSPACVDPAPAGAGPDGNGGYTKVDGAQDNAIDREVTQTEKAPGSVERVSVAVLLDSSVPNVDAAQIEELVTNAAGLQPARGDTVKVSRLPFDQSLADAQKNELKAAEEAEKKEQTMGLVKTGVTALIILVVLAMLFFLTKKRAGQYVSTPITMSELDAAMPALPSADEMLNAIETSASDNSPEALERAKVDKEITNLIERQPDEVATLLRSWLADRRT